MKTPFLWRPLLVGALALGTLDILDAIIFFRFRGVEPIKILQSIASGVLGPAAFEQGVGGAVLGLCLHFVIATGIVLVFYTFARNQPWALKNPILTGPAYGLCVWLVMNFLVVRFSHARNPNLITPIVINGLLIHMLAVGPTAVLATRAALREAPA